MKEDYFSREVVIELKKDCIKVLTHFVEKIQEKAQLKFSIACCVSFIFPIILVWEPDNIRKKRINNSSIQVKGLFARLISIKNYLNNRVIVPRILKFRAYVTMNGLSINNGLR